MDPRVEGVHLLRQAGVQPCGLVTVTVPMSSPSTVPPLSARPEQTNPPTSRSAISTSRPTTLAATPTGGIRHAYRERVNQLGARWSDTDLVAALRAFADATGLHCLHNVAS